MIFGHFVGGGLGLGGRYQHIHGRKFGVAKFKQKGLVINRIIEFYSIGFFVNCFCLANICFGAQQNGRKSRFSDF